MLQSIRDTAQGWIAWVIIILISIPFALWGIQEYLGVGGEPVAATVNGQEITDNELQERTRSARENLRLSLGSSYSPDLFAEEELRRQVMDQIIEERVLFEAAKDMGLAVANDSVRRFILSQKSFQQDGRFDVVAYENALRNRGMSKGGYEQLVRQDLLLRQFDDALRSSGIVTDSELAEYSRLQDQTRTLSYVVVPASSFMAAINPTEDELETYFKQQASAYMQPERVKLDYLVLDMAAIGEQIEVTETALQSYFEEHKGEFEAPEQRKLRHILIPMTAGDEEAKKQAEELRQRLLAGGDFAALAKEFSADPVSAAKGGELGWVNTGVMVKPFEDAAFALSEKQISEPVKSPFGYHLIEMLEQRGGVVADLDSVRDQVAAAYRRSEAEQLFYDYAERLANLSYEQPDSLMPAVEDLGLTLRHSDWLDHSGGTGDLASPKVVAVAFSEEVLSEGRNSEVIELNSESLLVLRVQAHEEAQPRPLSEVREAVLQAYKREQGEKLASKSGEAAVARLEAGADLSSVAAEAGWLLNTDIEADRDNLALPQEVLDQAFALPRPESGAPRYAGRKMASGDYVLVAVTGVKDGVLEDDTSKRLLENQVLSSRGRSELSHFVSTLRAQADVSLIEQR